MTTAEVAHQHVSLCQAGKYLQAIETLYSPEIVSVEAMEFGGLPRELTGVEAVTKKNLWWFANNEVHSASVSGPFVSPERFAVVFAFDRTSKSSGERSQISEVAVYTVEGGKIVREEFLYAAQK